MLLILLALLDTLPMSKTEFVDTIETTNNYEDFIVVTTEIWKGEMEWDAMQGDSLMTSGVPIGVYDYYRFFLDGVSNMILGWFTINELPMNGWEVVIANTGSQNQIHKAVPIWDKYKFFIGMRARTTGIRTVKIIIVKYRIGQ